MKGSLIKQHRKLNNMTLEELARGICSVSYLSKIEHNTINASEQIYRLLGERLNIALTDINQEFDETIYLDLINWHEAIQLRDFPLMKEYYEKNKKALEYNRNVELVNLYKVILARHNSKIEDEVVDEETLKELGNIYPNSTKEFQFFYHKVLGVHSLLKLELKEALYHFHKAEVLLGKVPHNDTEVYFHLALAYSQTHAAVESNYYAHMALDGYLNELDYERIVDTYMIIAINYRALNIFSLAEEYYLKLLKISKYHLRSLEKRRIYHNLGFIYANQERYEEAFDMLDKAFNIHTDEIFFEISTFYLLASTSYYRGNIEDCWNYIEEGEKKSEERNITFFKYKFFILKNTINKTTHEDQFINQVEHEIIPTLRENNQYGEYRNLLVMLGNIYYEKRMYKKSAMFFKEANNYKETQKKDLL
ncbi:helix-turn-helix domain-containing protein [Halobacillus mangrovi]|uniref:Transcriptional regulator n=1 Tax=Halobacillus mangrovi TaxID=402384 RepID=A0A1W5ZRF8_9BACI|nr:helix-turn-helix domain-containing protein [Halobacillus mangrovi]ARI75890.1 transcriptional regulator [Halobacillus mangrovi]